MIQDTFSEYKSLCKGSFTLIAKFSRTYLRMRDDIVLHTITPHLR